jgi:hypothetical protein
MLCRDTDKGGYAPEHTQACNSREENEYDFSIMWYDPNHVITQEEASHVLKEYTDKDSFINQNVEMGIDSFGDYTDNSLSLAKYWDKCVEVADCSPVC